MIFDFIHRVGMRVRVDLPVGALGSDLNGETGIVTATELDLDDDRPYHNITVVLDNGMKLALLDHHVEEV